MIKNITVLGAGIMGHGIAQVFAQADYPVQLYDLGEEPLRKAKESIENDLDVQVNQGIIEKGAKEAALSQLTFTTNLEQAVKDANYITEAVPEDLDIKHDLYKKIEPMISKDTILTSNTSALPLSSLTKVLEQPDRMLITHFFNPPQLVPLVEVVRSEHTSDNIVNETKEILEKCNKTPVALKKEFPGFVANRLQAALVREAFHIMKEDVADAEDIDKVITNGPGFRWAFIGPIETADFGGLDTWTEVGKFLFPKLSNITTPPEILKSKYDAGKLGVKSGEGFKTYTEEEATEKIKQRDNNFIELLKLKKNR